MKKIFKAMFLLSVPALFSAAALSSCKDRGAKNTPAPHFREAKELPSDSHPGISPAGAKEIVILVPGVHLFRPSPLPENVEETRGGMNPCKDENSKEG